MKDAQNSISIIPPFKFYFRVCFISFIVRVVGPIKLEGNHRQGGKLVGFKPQYRWVPRAKHPCTRISSTWIRPYYVCGSQNFLMQENRSTSTVLNKSSCLQDPHLHGLHTRSIIMPHQYPRSM